MEIKVNIPKNDYVQPTEVREKVVQDICNYIIYWMENGGYNGCYQLRIKDYHYQNAILYLIYSSSENTEICGLNDNGDMDKERYPFHVKVRTCEMQAVFKVMQKAGYHIFGWHCITENVHNYYFTKKPVLNGQKAKKIDFTLFID